jgi:hypothetical protein
MTGPRHYEHGLYGRPPAAWPLALALVIAFLACTFGCQGERKPPSKTGDTDKAETAVAQIARSRELDWKFYKAKTDDERRAIRDELIPHLKRRFSGIDCHASPDQQAAQLLAFRLLLREWPRRVGYSIEDLKAIAGKPSSETDDEVTYTFGTGKEAASWTFQGRPVIKRVFSPPIGQLVEYTLPPEGKKTVGPSEGAKTLDPPSG